MAVGETGWPDSVARFYRESGLWRGEALGGLLRSSAQRHPNQIALVDQGSRWTYSQLDEMVDHRAAGFAGYGINAGDRVIVQLPNIGEFVVVCFALWRIGACPVFCLPSYRETEIEHLFGLTEPVAYVIPDLHLGYDFRILATAMQRQFPSVRNVFVAGEPGDHIAVANVVSEQRQFPKPYSHETAFFLLSGGTTGLPKLIPRTHDDYEYQIRTSSKICGITKDSVYLGVLPVEFNFPWGCPGVMGTLAVGGTVVLSLPAAADELFTLIEKERVTFTSLVPSLVHQWLEELPYNTRDISSLAVLQVGGAPLHEDLAARIKPELGCILQQVYGMAEGLLCFTSLNSPQSISTSTQGRPLSSADELLVIDTKGQEVAEGEIGELLTRGPYTIRGYYRGGQHNINSFDTDGYYRTGDLVRISPDGSVIVVGRRKEIIIRGGDKISPAEVENYLLSHPGIRQVAVIAIPHAVLGECTCACIVPSGDPVNLAQVRSALQRRGVADYKLPDRLEILSQLPTTALGKINKTQLVAQFARTSGGTNTGVQSNVIGLVTEQ